jgi:chaperonin GroES
MNTALSLANAKVDQLRRDEERMPRGGHATLEEYKDALKLAETARYGAETDAEKRAGALLVERIEKAIVELKPEIAGGFPWIAFGNNIVIRMLKDEERVSDGGIVLPAITERTKNTIGGVVTVGHGEWIPNIGWVNPMRDHDIHVGDVLMIYAGTGHDIRVDGIEYKIVTQDDIVAVLNRTLGKTVRERMIGLIKRSSRRHKGLGDEAGSDTQPDPIPVISGPSYPTVEEHQEEVRTKVGKATRTGVGPGGMTRKGENIGGK